MPRVQVYQPDQVAPAETTGARHRAADMAAGGLAIAQGVTNLGRAGADYAEAQEEINLRFDDTESRKAAQRYQTGAAKILSDFQLESGANAYTKRPATDEALAKLREETLGGTTNERMRRMTDDRIAGLYGADTVKIGEHATRQLRVEQEGTLKSQVVLSGEDAAANWDRPDIMGAHIDTMKAAVDELGQLSGWSADQVRLEKSNAVSAVHKDVVNRMLADDDIDAAQVYLEANADELNANDELAIRGAMKDPLLTRQAEQDFLGATAGAAVDAPAGEGQSFTYGQPVKGGTYTSGYGVRNGEMHNGVDIAAPIGSAINPIAPGKVVAVTSDGRSGNYVVIDHGDGYTSSYSHMGKQAVRVGDTVTQSTVLGAIGMTGRTTGPHVHLVVRKGKEHVDPKRLMGTTGVAGSGATAQRWDKASVYDSIETRAKAEGWSPERKERAMAWADRVIARDEQLKARDEDAAEREASEWVIKNPNFTDISQMPAGIRDRLGPEARLRYMDAGKRNAKPVDAPANGADALALNLMSIYDPEGFKSMSLGPYAGRITRSELEGLATKQAKMRVEKPKDTRMRSGITGAIGWGEKYGGLGEFNEEQRVAIYGIMESDARRLSEDGKKELTEQDYQNLFKRATREVPTTTWYGGSSSRAIYDMGASNIPDATRKKIEDSYRRTYGKDPTDEQVADYWRRHYAK